MSPGDADATQSSEVRVIVVGCGLAGLSCASQLVKQGVDKDKVVLLEASNRIGGRVKTDTNFVEGFSLDLGAELIHGNQTSTYRLAEDRGWEMEELITLAQGDGGPFPAESNDGYGLFYIGSEKRMLHMASKDVEYVRLNKYFGALANLWPGYAQRDVQGEEETSARELKSLHDGLAQAGVTTAMMGIAAAGYANTVGAALEDIGLRGTCFLEHAWEVDGDQTFVLKGSLGQVVEELSAGLESCIQTEWPVAKIDYGGTGSVTVTCKDGRTEQGTHVVSAVPLSVLQDGDVAFLPALPDRKVAALHCMGMSRTVKVILRFDRPVLDPLLQGCICGESFIPEFWFRHLPDLPAGGSTMLAVGFAAGPPADVIAACEAEDAITKALDQLDDMFRGTKWLRGSPRPETDRQHKRSPSGDRDASAGREARPESPDAEPLPSKGFVRGLVHDWADEPFVRGGYCYQTLDFDEHTHAHVAEAMDARLFFAGEHTNTPTGMTIHAAMDSGRRAASEVMSTLKIPRPQDAHEVTEDSKSEPRRSATTQNATTPIEPSTDESTNAGRVRVTNADRSESAAADTVNEQPSGPTQEPQPKTSAQADAVVEVPSNGSCRACSP